MLLITKSEVVHTECLAAHRRHRQHHHHHPPPPPPPSVRTQLKNAGKGLRKIVQALCTDAAGLTPDRLRGFCGDLRHVLQQCHEDCIGKTEEECEKVYKHYADFHIPQIVRHHRGDCANCDPKWCYHRRIQLEHPDLTPQAQEQMYFARGSRYWAFIDVTDKTADALIAYLKKRYPPQQLRALTHTICDNNNVERIWTR